jgi:membrane-bound lytic murein transglycosylase MltF
VVQYLRAKADLVKSKKVRDTLNDALTRLDLTAQTVVQEVNQTMREKVEVDGKLTPKAGHELLQTAYARIKSRLPADAKATLEAAFPDRQEGENLLQKVIIGKIEKTVAETKPCAT